MRVTHDLQPTIDRIRSGKLFTFRHDGSIYRNKDGLLPNLSNGVYKEYIHPTPGLMKGAGTLRIYIEIVKESIILWQKYDDHNVAFIFNEKEKDVIMTIFNGYNPYYG